MRACIVASERLDFVRVLINVNHTPQCLSFLCTCMEGRKGNNSQTKHKQFFFSSFFWISYLFFYSFSFFLFTRFRKKKKREEADIPLFSYKMNRWIVRLVLETSSLIFFLCLLLSFTFCIYIILYMILVFNLRWCKWWFQFKDIFLSLARTLFCIIKIKTKKETYLNALNSK